MLPFLTKNEAVADMHERGFSNDFQLFGNDLLWVQEKTFIRMGEFAIVEYHRFVNLQGNRIGTIVFGVVSHHHHVKGILIKDYANDTRPPAPVIIKKMNELIAATQLLHL